jgi:acetoacetyl-CoA reductase
MPAAVLERIMAAVPSGRLGEPDEIAALVAYLAGPAAGYVTGEAISIDGGTHLNTMALAGE